MNEPWRELKPGDLVRIVRMPSGVDAPGYTFHHSTRRLYEALIASCKAFPIAEVDHKGYPWIEIRVIRKKDSQIEHHSLALCDDSWERVMAEAGSTAGTSRNCRSRRRSYRRTRNYRPIRRAK